MSDFGERLRAIRKDKGWSQEELAEILGTSKQVISRYENGQRAPKVTVAAEFAKRLGIPLTALSGEAPVESSLPSELKSFSDTLYISRPSGNKSTDELRAYLHDIIDQMDDEDLKFFRDITIRMRGEK